MPTIRDGFRQVYANAGSDGRARFDLVGFLGDIFFRNAAALIGLSGVDSPAAAQQLREFSVPMLTATDFMELRDREARMRRAVELKQEFFEQYYCPALSPPATLRTKCRWRIRRHEEQFLAAAIHETLRLHTLVPYLWRRAEEDVALASGVKIERGQCVLLGVDKANRDESVFGSRST